MSWYLFFAPLGGQNIIWILVTSGYLLSKKVWWAVRMDSFCPKLRYFRPEWNKGGDHTKMNLDYFQIQEWTLQTVREEKAKMKKMAQFVYFPCTLPGLWFLIFSSKVYFLQFCADLSKKPKSVKVIYIYASESSHYFLIVCTLLPKFCQMNLKGKN